MKTHLTKTLAWNNLRYLYTNTVENKRISDGGF